jgi:hypothetical protein
LLGLALAFFLCYPNSSLALSGKIWQVSTETAKQSNPIVFKPQVGLPGFDQQYTFNENSTMPIAVLMQAIYNYGIKIVGLLALITIIIGGFLWSMAGGNSQKVKEAQQWIFSGLGGVLLMLFAYLILRTINVNLVSFKPSTIDPLVGLNLIIPEKSNQEQAAGDQAFLDEYYAAAIGENPDLEACCVYYNDSALVKDTIRSASIAYSQKNIGDAQNTCLDYGNKWAKQDKKSNAKKYYSNKTPNNDTDAQFIILGKDNTTKDSIEHKFLYWDKSDFATQAKDLALFFVTDSACWNLDGLVGKSSMGLDDSEYCEQVNNDGQACIKDIGGKKIWGYCQSDICNICSSYGEKCSSNYQCPNKKELIGSSTIVSGWQCGNSGISGLANGGTCAQGCVCAIQDCFAECSKNLVNKNLLKSVCQ